MVFILTSCASIIIIIIVTSSSTASTRHNRQSYTAAGRGPSVVSENSAHPRRVRARTTEKNKKDREKKEYKTLDMADLHLAKPITLRCGLTLPNRLAKTAIAESIAPRNMLIDEGFQRVYRPWAEGGWGMVLTGTWYYYFSVRDIKLVVFLEKEIPHPVEADAEQAMSKLIQCILAPIPIQQLTQLSATARS